MDLDQYIRAGLDSEVSAVLEAAKAWRDRPCDKTNLALRGATDQLAAAQVRWEKAVEEYKGSNGEPAKLCGKSGWRE